MTAPLPSIIRSPALAALRFSGADAVSFLHNQLSTDVAGMAVGVVDDFERLRGEGLCQFFSDPFCDGHGLVFLNEGARQSVRLSLSRPGSHACRAGRSFS